MRPHISTALRAFVMERALNHCEYCLSYQSFSFAKFQIEHIISLKHGGATVPENLACSCIYCNRNKGSDVGTILSGQKFERFFNPRTDKWAAHFEVTNALILPKSIIGEATVKILDFNQLDRLVERTVLVEKGQFPHIDAFKIMF